MRHVELSAFAHIEPVPVQVTENLSMAELPTLEQVRSLANWTTEMVEKFSHGPDWYSGPPKRDRSFGMAEFAYLAAEHKWNDEQIYVALLDLDTRLGKYVGRRDRERRLVDFINRARTKVGYEPVSINPVDLLQALAQSNDNGKLVWNLGDFLKAEFKINWLLEGLHESGGFGLVTGFPGVGKTQFALSMGIQLAIGRQHFLQWENRAEPQRVLFISLEMGKPPLHLFLENIVGGYPDHEERRRLYRNFQVAPLGAGMPLDTKDGQEFLEQLLVEHMPDLVIIDSLQKIISKELTDEVGVKALVEYLRHTRMKHNCSMVVIHHNRKKSNDAQKRQGVELSDVYGSVYLTAEVDWVLSLMERSTDQLQVDMLKNRLGANKGPFNITRDSHLGFEIDGNDVGRQYGDE